MSCFTAKPSCLGELRRSLGDRGLRGQTHRPLLRRGFSARRGERRSLLVGGQREMVFYLPALCTEIVGAHPGEGESGDVPGSGSRAACQAVIEVLEGCAVMALPSLPRAPTNEPHQPFGHGHLNVTSKGMPRWRSPSTPARAQRMNEPILPQRQQQETSSPNLKL